MGFEPPTTILLIHCSNHPTIQLRHVFTGKFVHVSTRQTSWTESSNLSVELKPENSKRAQFKILPRYKVKSEGDLVRHIYIAAVKLFRCKYCMAFLTFKGVQFR